MGLTQVLDIGQVFQAGIGKKFSAGFLHGLDGRPPGAKALGHEMKLNIATLGHGQQGFDIVH